MRTNNEHFCVTRFMPRALNQCPKRAGSGRPRPGPRAGPGGPDFFGGGPGRAEGRDFEKSRGPELYWGVLKSQKIACGAFDNIELAFETSKYEKLYHFKKGRERAENTKFSRGAGPGRAELDFRGAGPGRGPRFGEGGRAGPRNLGPFRTLL